MNGFDYRDDQLFVDGVSVRELVNDVGSPAYIYSARALRAAFEHLQDAFAALDPLICYSVKANSNLAILDVLKDLGAGFDIVSGGELHRVCAVGATPANLVFAGVGKSDDELMAGLRFGVGCFNVESASELERLSVLAGRLGTTASVALRVNPDVEADTHRHIATGHKATKFGLAWPDVVGVAKRALALPNVTLCGLHAHIGSQIKDPAPYGKALERVLALANDLRDLGAPLTSINLGGGFGINYERGCNEDLAPFAQTITALFRSTPYRLSLEPGRCIAANAGALIARILHVKHSYSRRYLIVDTGMHHLIRPALYSAHHRVTPVCGSQVSGSEGAEPGSLADVVGPICETADTIATQCQLPAMEPGELVAIWSAGAYGMTMASQYNSHPRPVEVLVEGDTWRVIRPRESYDDLLRLEQSVYASAAAAARS